MDFHQHVKPEAEGMVVQHLQFDRPQRCDDEQHCVGAGRPGFDELIFRDQKILPEDRQIDRLAH